MFSSLLNSAKDILENAQQGNASQTNPQPSPQSNQAGRQEGGGDLFSGILNAVGKTLSEGSQPATQQAPQPPPPSSAGDGNHSSKSSQGFNIRPEDVAMITKGLGVLAQVVKERTSAKGPEGEQPANMDPSAGKTPSQPAGGAEQSDFLSGLMNVVNQLGNTNKPAPQGATQSGSQLSQEDIARITAGLGSLATTLKEKAFGGSTVEEESVAKLDAQGGKLQVSSVVEKSETTGKEQAPAAGGDFLSGLMNVAKDVGKALGEQKQGAPAANSSGNTTQQGGLSQEDIARITAGLGSLADIFKTKVAKKDVEEQVTKADAHSGQTHMSLLDKADAQAEQRAQQEAASGDFLSGLLSVAKDVGKAVEQNQSGTTAKSSGHESTASSQGGSQLSQEDIAKLTAGLGSLVGVIQGKATDYFHKTPPAEEQKKPVDEPVVDDIEEEIGKVVLPGYTGYTDASAASKPKTN
ncbi:hypothetical protein GCK32_002423 [Trichostrongylus colubriformis]|uniref:Uncharacterized protein n=1 Tax=Trichostrongylus colubriformis TaxID=6319 RepID=A0AAN8G2N1_TRICO